MPERPPSLRIFGLLNVAFGAFGLLWNPALFFAALVLAWYDPTDTWSVQVARDPVYRGYLLISTVLAIAACKVEIFGGIGLLLGRRWGWQLSLGYAIYSLIAPILDFLANYGLSMHGAILKAGRAGDQDAFWSEVSAMSIFLLYSLAMTIYPAVLLYAMTRPSVRRYFAALKLPPRSADAHG